MSNTLAINLAKDEEEKYHWNPCQFDFTYYNHKRYPYLQDSLLKDPEAWEHAQ